MTETTTEIRQDSSGRQVFVCGKPLKMLTLQQIRQIDDALAELGPYAEIKLIKNKGRLRFIQKIESESMI